jgi:FAD binding domain/Berberine and berberine like
MADITRRSFVSRVAGGTVAAPVFVSASRADVPLPPLPSLSSEDALLLRSGDGQYADYQAAFNLRTALKPQLRALCKTCKAISVMLDWCRSNGLPFAVRCGGHSYEGFSQSTSVVIDMRLRNAITVDAKADTATVGAGASLGSLYRAIASHGLAFTGGSCPTVGVSGHLLGGGYGYLARPSGLACDSLLSVDLINPSGLQVHADAHQNADLYWACRGGGGGSFGIATSFTVRLKKVANVIVFRVVWPGLSIKDAKGVMRTWQRWAPKAPRTIDSNFVVSKGADGTVNLHTAGQSVGSLTELQRELQELPKSPSVLIRRMTFGDAVDFFSGGSAYPIQFMKGKSDYATAQISDQGLEIFMTGLAQGLPKYVVCDAYGGALAEIAPDATAFAHRGGTLFCLQYGSVWDDPAHTKERLDDMSQFYASLRPYMSGSAYVNYCDLDLADYATAYWGENLPRLKQIKAGFDPSNVFWHAQSVPLS